MKDPRRIVLAAVRGFMNSCDTKEEVDLVGPQVFRSDMWELVKLMADYEYFAARKKERKRLAV